MLYRNLSHTYTNLQIRSCNSRFKQGWNYDSKSLQPQEVHIPHPVQLEVKTISVTTPSSTKIYIVAVYRRPQFSTTIFMRELSDYLFCLPHNQCPTVILGDFNEHLLAMSSLTTFFLAKRFSQLIKAPTTDGGSLLDHIYYNSTQTHFEVDVVDTYYSDHDATFLSYKTPFYSNHPSWSRKLPV